MSKVNKGKITLLEQLREEAAQIRRWMYDHSSPSTPAAEFCRVANQYAILCTRISVIDKHW